MSDPLEIHYQTVVKALLDGRVVPLLGAGVNLYGRPAEVAWQQGSYLPSGTELSAYLASSFSYPSPDTDNLARVSQYISVINGVGPLYEELHKLFNADYPPTPLHRLLARLPSLFRRHQTGRYQLIVTTNYDDALEQAFREAGEPFDLVTYMAEGEDRGKFLHFSPDRKSPVPIERPNKYTGLSLERRTVIAKIHGAVDRLNADQDSYVITEDHYIDYLTRTDISNLIPATLAEKLKRSHFLFLGYSMRDWNLRVILHRIWGAQQLSYNSWAVHRAPEAIDQEFWRKRGVDTVHIALEDYVTGLTERLDGRLAPEVAS
jgi:SIR2-like domain